MASGWPVTADGQYYQAEGKFLIPVDPSSGAAIIMLRPEGGIGVGFTAVEKGDPGKHAEIDETTVFTPLAWDDPTPASFSWTPITPPTDTTPGVWRAVVALHEGKPGDNGDTVLDPSDFEGAAAGKFPVVNADVDGFELQSQKVGSLWIPATVNSTPSGNPNYTLATRSIPAQDFDYRLRVLGSSIITGTGADVRVDLVARLNDESGGNIVARAIGMAGQNPPPHKFDPLPPAGSPLDYYKVPKGQPAMIYIRAERQSGSETFTTSAATSLFGVEVVPLP